MAERRKSTSTSAFGVGKRESHDASDFYARFTTPELAPDDDVVRSPVLDQLFVGDAREMAQVPTDSVALVVTSPPYFAGKEYENDLTRGDVPKSYFEYLAMLEDVFDECRRTLEPGGRIAVNVANLGRRPYRSLSSDVTTILQNLGLWLRGEIIWQKAEGASGSCAWGSFQSPANPVLRDLTERVIVASKGRFDRAVTRRRREQRGLPHEATMWRDEFMEATTDVWRIPPESATKVGHPAPFPVELPQRLIHLFTYRDDLILDPFMGVGSTAIAAVRTDRRYVGYDLDESYIELAEQRLEEERTRSDVGGRRVPEVRLPARPEPGDTTEDFQSRAVREGHKAKGIARAVLQDCGFKDLREDLHLTGGVEMNLSACDRRGRRWYFDVSGAFTSTRAGLRRTDTVWKALGKAGVLQKSRKRTPIILLTTDLPPKASAGNLALKAAREGGLIVDFLEMLSLAGQERLAQYASGESRGESIGGPLPPEFE